MNNGKIVRSLFKPAWWCANRHSQTLYPTIFRKPVPLNVYHEKFELPDGDFLDLAWTEEKQLGPVVILLHGLEGSIHSPYAKGILKTVQNIGWQGVLMHFRGCGNQHNRLARAYHSGDTDDLDTLIKTLKARFPNRAIAAIGVSLGGNVLLKYLGEQGNTCVLSAAMAISIPFDLADSSRQLNKGFARIYQRHLLSRLQKKMHDKFKNQASPISRDKLNGAATIWEFDNNVTAPLHGFIDADDYYSKSSSKQVLKHIAIPTLILHCKNDPFMTHNIIPNEAELSSSVTLELTEHGGHVGFVYGKTPFGAKYWIEKRLVEFFKNELCL